MIAIPVHYDNHRWLAQPAAVMYNMKGEMRDDGRKS